MPEFRIITRCPKCNNRTLIQRTEDIDRRIRRQRRDKTDWTKHYLTCPKCGWEIWNKSDDELWKELENMYRIIKIKGLEKGTRRQVLFEVRATESGVHLVSKSIEWENVEEGSIRLSTGLFDNDENEIYDNDVLDIYDTNGEQFESGVVAYNNEKAMYCLYPVGKEILEKGIHKLPLGQTLAKFESYGWNYFIVGTRRCFEPKQEKE